MATKVTTDPLYNPWALMEAGAERRIDSALVHNVFWVTDLQGSYGIGFKRIASQEDWNISLRGISTVRRGENENSEFFLVLRKHDDWQLFYTLCQDLISVCYLSNDQAEMLKAVKSRLQQWQLFLKQGNELLLSIQSQMGLFTELLCLKDYVIPYLGIEGALLSWGGPDAERQDFSLPDFLLEVKSYILSKGAQVTISSAYQLHSDFKPLFLSAIGLTQSETGRALDELVAELAEMVRAKSIALLESLEHKLMAYGFMPGLQQQLFAKFKVDAVRWFEVAGAFPRITPPIVAPEITSVKYIVDLDSCNAFEIDAHAVFLV